MSLTYDVRSNLTLLVDLLNTAPGIVDQGDTLATATGLTRFAEAHSFTGQLTASAFDVVAVAGLRDRFRVVLDQDPEAVVAAINDTFGEIRAFPRLVRHGEWDWHFHATGDSAPLGERIASDIVFLLADLIRFDDLTRLRECAAEDCSAAFVDLTRNRSKRFCDARGCANRLHAAAYRARQSEGARGSAAAE